MQISCKYNIPPLPGRTLVICNADISDDRDWSGADDLCLPPESTKDIDENKLSASVRYMSILLFQLPVQYGFAFMFFTQLLWIYNFVTFYKLGFLYKCNLL